MSPQYTIDQLVVAYNAHDVRGFADSFAEQASIYEHPGTPTQPGLGAVLVDSWDNNLECPH